MKLGAWGWLVYPVTVTAFVVVSAMVIAQNKDRFTQAVLGDAEQEAVQAQVAELRERLAVLETVDKERDLEDLKIMARAVLPNKAVWLTSTELRDAASVAGVRVERYRSDNLGNVAEEEASEAAAPAYVSPMAVQARVVVSGVDQLSEMLKNLENRVPLVRVIEINYQTGFANLVVEGAWDPWVGGASPSGQLADYRSKVTEVVKRLEALEAYPEAVILDITDDPATNPF